MMSFLEMHALLHSNISTQGLYLSREMFVYNILYIAFPFLNRYNDYMMISVTYIHYSVSCGSLSPCKWWYVAGK